MDSPKPYTQGELLYYVGMDFKTGVHYYSRKCLSYCGKDIHGRHIYTKIPPVNTWNNDTSSNADSDLLAFCDEVVESQSDNLKPITLNKSQKEAAPSPSQVPSPKITDPKDPKVISYADIVRRVLNEEPFKPILSKICSNKKKKPSLPYSRKCYLAKPAKQVDSVLVPPSKIEVPAPDTITHLPTPQMSPKSNIVILQIATAASLVVLFWHTV